jgi:hypothetical protein
MSIDPSTSGTLDFKQASKVTFIGSSSNTVIDTVTGSFGIGVDVNGPSSNLHVVGNTRLEGDINMLHTSNNAAIKLNSNVVTEFPRSKKLIKYPRVALTQNALNNGYTVIQSGTNGHEPRKAWSLFNNDVTTDDQYHAVPASGESNPYNPSTGAYEPDAGFEYGLGDVAGEYVYVVMPDKIKLQGVSVHPRDGVLNRSAESARFMGSNDGNTWVNLGGYSNYVWASGSQEPGNFFTVDSDEYYNYIGVVWTKVKGGSGGDTVNMAEVQFFGIPEYDPDAAGVDVKVTSYPNVPNTDWLEVYYDAKDLVDGAVTSVDDLTPSGTNDGTATNVTVSDGAFVFNGTSSLLEKTSLSIPGGDNPFTFSFWIKNDTFDATQYILRLGDNQTMYQNVNIYKTSSNQIVFTTWLLDFPINYTFTSNRWNHISLMYPGGGWAQSNLIVYVDGKRFNFGANRSSGGTGGNDMTLATSLTLRLGGFSSGNMHFDGSIANFRLFNRAITSDEVWQLYSYQKEYFGHGDLGMTLKAGRLNVRGDISCDGVVKPYTCAFSAYVSSGGNSSTTGIFPADSVHFNIGNCYNTSTYEFTAPVHGIYHMSFSAFTNQAASTASRIFARLNNVTVEQVGATIEDHGNSLSLTVQMNGGDIFHFNGGSSTPIYYFGAAGHNRFCGHLICAL